MGEVSGKVLIVIPTLNRPELCARAVQSVLRQKYENWLCFIALNGISTDGVRVDLAHPTHDAYADTLRESLNGPDAKVVMGILAEKGLGAALNFGLSCLDEYYQTFVTEPVQFDYWMSLEDDDELDPDYLETMVGALERSGADVAHCLQRQLPRKIQSNGGAMDAAQLQKRNWVNWPMCLWKRGVYERVGPIAEDVGPATDWDYHLRCVAAGVKYHSVDAVLVTHHWHDDNYCLHVDGKQYIAKKRQEGAYG